MNSLEFAQQISEKSMVRMFINSSSRLLSAIENKDNSLSISKKGEVIIEGLIESNFLKSEGKYKEIQSLMTLEKEITKHKLIKSFFKNINDKPLLRRIPIFGYMLIVWECMFEINNDKKNFAEFFSNPAIFIGIMVLEIT